MDHSEGIQPDPEIQHLRGRTAGLRHSDKH